MKSGLIILVLSDQVFIPYIKQTQKTSKRVDIRSMGHTPSQLYQKFHQGKVRKGS